MRGVDSIEFYRDGSTDKYFARVESSMPPQIGDFINIRGKVYEVMNRSFCVDHSDDFTLTAMRCNVDVKLRKPKAKRRSSPTSEPR
jgi:hypothetical protein